ncbi:MAG: FAD-dependent oxidoreductase, partial [Myxococcota bacterium]
MADLPAQLGATLPPHLATRCRLLGEAPESAPRYVLYWLRTAVRAHENPALDVALTLGAAHGVPVFVYHALSERYPYASDRHHTFILEGARELRSEMRARGVGYAFHLERRAGPAGTRGPVLKTLARDAGLVVTELMPVPPLSGWTRALAAEATVLEVDTACVVAMPLTGRAPERAFRFKNATKKHRKRALGAPWDDVPGAGAPFVPEGLPFTPLSDADVADVPGLVASCAIDHGVGPVPHTPGGSAAGYARWEAFVASGGLRAYGRRRNDPLKRGVSRMSAYLHYGMVSPLRLAREAFAEGSEGATKYLDELLVWRELAYHWCFHTPDPESYEEAIPAWAQETLDAARGDARELLDREALARGRTGDALWDACQASLLRHGELHNNVRMTWGKAIPFWSASPREAMARLIDLNHRYALDGRDPASYGGLLWCLGLFDAPKAPGPVLGKVRGRPTAVHARRLDVAAYADLVRRPAHPAPPRTLVVGAGFAGLSCARALADHGWDVTVVDKGRRHPGGRCSTRAGEGWSFDHGAQLLATEDPILLRYARAWRERGLLAPWEGRFGTFEGDAFRARAMEAYVGVPGMNALARHLAADVNMRQGLRVARLQRRDAGWVVALEDGAELGAFDRLVLALPAAQAAPLLAEAGHGFAARLGAVEVQASLTAMVAFAGTVEVPFDAASTDGDAPLAWMARESSKPGRPGLRESGFEAWTLQASPVYSAAHLELDKDAIAEDLLGRFRALAEPLQGAPLPDAPMRMGHRWRYAQTATPLGESCLFDEVEGLGLCGDWCLGDRLEHA